jgi:hypothetical protein
MACPDRRAQQPNPCARSSGDSRFGESLGVQVLRRLSEVDLELLELSTNVLVNVVFTSDELAGTSFTDPFAPDVILGVPPLVLFGGFEEADPSLDHATLASEHRGPGSHMELTVGETNEPRLEVEIAWLQQLVGFRELH